MKQYCTECGALINSNDKFCSNCGSEVYRDNLDLSVVENSHKNIDSTINEVNKTKSKVESASAEKTIEFETEEGTVKEKTTVNYKIDQGNRIDNVVSTVAESKSVQKAASFLNKVIRLGLTGFGGISAGAITYDIGEHKYYHWSYEIGRRSYWEVPEQNVIATAVIIGIVVAGIIFSFYTKWFIRK